MDEKDYKYEARYIRAIRGWRQACDQRGLSELERCRHNYNLLNFILEELMPWYTQSYDFSLLEVNRFVYIILHLQYDHIVSTLDDLYHPSIILIV